MQVNRFAYQTTGLVIRAISEISKAKIVVHGHEHLPRGAIIFAPNHFTRMETLFLPYHIHKKTNAAVWSLADYTLFKGGLGNYLNKVGALSTKNPDRDLLIVKTLLTGEAHWVIFPEGRMVKSKKVIEGGRGKQRFMITHAEGSHAPHTGAATLALRTEFYRERIGKMLTDSPSEAERLLTLYRIEDVDAILNRMTFIVPVNITYYPIRARENLLSKLLTSRIEDISDRYREEIITESTMLVSGVDVDIRFGEAIRVGQYMKSKTIRRDIESPQPIQFDDPIASRRIMKAAAAEIMERYMSSIYRMTTVNHDHLFASFLRLLPLKKIEKQDLKNRVYLSTTLKIKDVIYHHDCLNLNQIHLLTDDRYRKFEHFMALALEKGVAREENGWLIKNPAFTADADFHRVRLENPVAVIANEVEPLTAFQEHMERIAWQPPIRIKYWIAKHLFEKAEFHFEKDYTNFFIEGESKPKSIGKPFLLKSKNRRLGIVLIHGYMAAPKEVRHLAEYLNGLGCWVYAPRLKGHGTSPVDLAGRNYMEWVECVEEACVAMRYSCRRILVGGFSTGAGLALDAVSRMDDIAGVFAVSPPFKLNDISSHFVPAVDLWNRIMKRVGLDGAKREFVENRPENPETNYLRNPIAGVRELDRLMESIQPRIPLIRQPALVIQSQRDPVVNPRGALAIFEQLASEEKEYLLINSNRHGILNGDGALRVYEAIRDFIRRVADIDRGDQNGIS